MFESHGGILSGESFATYCIPYLSQIAQRVKENLTKNKIAVVPMVLPLLLLEDTAYGSIVHRLYLLKDHTTHWKN